MVSTYAIHYRNRKTCEEMLRIDPRERERRAGGDPAVRRGPRDDALRGRLRGRGGGRRDRHQHGLPGAEGRQDRRRRGRCCATPSAPSRSPRRPSRGAPSAPAAPLPVTAKLRSGMRAGDSARLRAGPPAGGRGRRRRDRLPRRARRPSSTRAPRLRAGRRARRARLPAPVILTGGLNEADEVREAFAADGRHGRDAGPRRARQPVAVPRAAQRRASTGRARAGGARASSSGPWRAPVEHLGAERAAPATRASSTPGTWSASGSPPGPHGRSRRSSSRPPRWSGASAADRRRPARGGGRLRPAERPSPECRAAPRTPPRGAILLRR